MLFPLYFYISKQRQKIWYAAAMIIGLGTLYLTSSRASWIAAIVGMFVIGVVVKRDRRVMIAGAVVLGCALIYLIGFAVVKQNISSITEKPTQSFGERVFEAVSLRAWRESYDGYGRIFFIINTPRMVIREFPFFGVGPGRYGGGVAAALLMTDVYDRLHLPFGIQNIYGQIDNNWMSIWGETGTFGLLVWIGMFVSVMHMAWYVIQKTESREEKMIAEGVLGFTAGLICMGFFGPYFEFRALMFYYWTIAGIVMLYWYREKHRGNILEGK
jgi:O-antigen ligase